MYEAVFNYKGADSGDYDYGNHFLSKLLAGAAENKLPIQMHEDFTNDDCSAKIFDLIDKRKLKLIYKKTTEEIIVSSFLSTESKPGGDFLFVKVCETRKREDASITVKIMTSYMNESLIEDLSPLMINVARDRSIYTISSSSHGLYLVSLGVFKYDFIDDNYEDKTLSDYKYISKQLSAKKPNGRLSILCGEPGTGKTNMAKGIIQSLEGCLTVLLPSKMTSELDGPQMIKMLSEELSAKDQALPLVLIIEDADECLVPRSADNMSTISTLLNITDGILGSCFDIRILATTNASNIEIDKALLRVGRLAKITTVGALSKGKASAVYERLSGGKKKEYESNVILAEVYKDALGDNAENNNVVEFQNKKSTVGFNIENITVLDDDE